MEREGEPSRTLNIVEPGLFSRLTDKDFTSGGGSTIFNRPTKDSSSPSALPLTMARAVGAFRWCRSLVFLIIDWWKLSLGVGDVGTAISSMIWPDLRALINFSSSLSTSLVLLEDELVVVAAGEWWWAATSATTVTLWYWTGPGETRLTGQLGETWDVLASSMRVANRWARLLTVPDGSATGDCPGDVRFKLVDCTASWKEGELLTVVISATGDSDWVWRLAVARADS